MAPVTTITLSAWFGTLALCAVTGCLSSEDDSSGDASGDAVADTAVNDSAQDGTDGGGCVTYVDRCCTPDPDASSWACSDVGDGVCYQTCSSDSDCKDATRSHCSKQCLCGNTDSFRTARKVCRAKAEDDCAL